MACLFLPQRKLYANSDFTDRAPDRDFAPHSFGAGITSLPNSPMERMVSAYDSWSP